MSNMSSLIALIVLGMCCMSSGFLVKSSPPNPSLLLYFEKVVVSVKAVGQEAKYHKVEFNTNNTVITYNVIDNAPNKNFTVSLDFANKDSGTADLTVKTLSMKWTVVATGRQYLTVPQVLATIQGTSGGNAFGGENLRLISQIKLEAPLDYSFHCGKFGKMYPAFVDDGNNNSTLPFVEIHGLQIQAFTNGSATFSKSWDCVGFFSAGIWSGIFILAILIGVVTWGLAMIMDVKTMDRFDDPKGKPISFAGSE